MPVWTPGRGTEARHVSQIHLQLTVREFVAASVPALKWGVLEAAVLLRVKMAMAAAALPLAAGAGPASLVRNQAPWYTDMSKMKNKGKKEGL